MIKRLNQTLLIGFLSAQLIVVGCTHTATIKQPAYEPLRRSSPISDEALSKIHQESPKDGVFADLLQAFALMRSEDITDPKVRKEIVGLLATSVHSFEDMTDPVNFSEAFTADESKPFRGRPHERMFASAMAGVLLMGENNCTQALPYLRNAEFLDARFQRLPFGTDAPLIYSLMYRCLRQENASADDIARASDGVYRSVRFLTMQESLLDALTDLASIELRAMAVANRMAYMVYEISLYHSLISAPNSFTPIELVEDATRNASLFISALKTTFDDEYETKMKPMLEELARVHHLNKKTGVSALEEVAFDRILVEASTIGNKMKRLIKDIPTYQNAVHAAHAKSRELTDTILVAAAAPKMMLTFSGEGPTLVREGEYQEVSVIKPGPDASTAAPIRQRSLFVNTACGFHRTENGGFSVVMCKPGIGNHAKVEKLPSLELMSLSRKATTAQGRKFDKVLRGRAQFRAATEKLSEVTAWSAFFLFYLGSQMINDCQRRGQASSCYTSGYVMWGLGAVTALFSGAVWLAGRSKNPAADSRFIHLMYESAWVSLKSSGTGR